MYTFQDRGGDSITLRPDVTAGVARAFISGGLSQNLPLKLFYAGPMFRYERPQKGRQRQFHQIGVEIPDVPAPLTDHGVIAFGAHILATPTLLERNRHDTPPSSRWSSKTASRNVRHEYLDRHQDMSHKHRKTP